MKLKKNVYPFFVVVVVLLQGNTILPERKVMAVRTEAAFCWYCFLPSHVSALMQPLAVDWAQITN